MKFPRFNFFSQSFRIKSQYYYEKALNNKKYLAMTFILTYIPFFTYYSYTESNLFTIVLTRAVQKLSQAQIPKFSRNFLFGTYSKIYNVNQNEMIKSFQEYSTFSQFFSRKIKQRQINKHTYMLTSPCDGKVLSISQIKKDSCFVIKNYNYSLGYLLCGQQVQFKSQDINKIKKNINNKLYHIIIYLAPGDYHRFHAPINFQINRRKSIQGFLSPVNEQTLIKRQKVYQKNSRLILHGKYEHGYFGMILIGALNVGRIVIKQKMNYLKGQQIGYFNLGSTILLLIESQNIQWNVKQQQKVRYGQVIGKIIIPQQIKVLNENNCKIKKKIEKK